jgi:predicted ABC-type transport system involved in lysophospholipase L1 biosynthesis ATPase subunit
VTDTALKFAGVSKNYGGLRPLRIHELAVGSGDTVAIVGFDQVCAEVFVNLATGATLPEAGEVRVFGRATSDIADSDDWLATADRFGIVSERAVLLGQLTALQNLAMPFTLEVEPMPEDVRAKAVALATEIAFDPPAWHRPIAALDADATMRLRLGRALALEPRVLLLEHVSAGLPPEAAVRFGVDVRAIAARRGVALVAMTVDAAFAGAVAGRVLQWDAATGHLVEQRRDRWFGRWLG